MVPSHPPALHLVYLMRLHAPHAEPVLNKPPESDIPVSSSSSAAAVLHLIGVAKPHQTISLTVAAWQWNCLAAGWVTKLSRRGRCAVYSRREH